MAYKITLSNEESNELENRISSERDSKIYKRLQCIKLKHQKYQNKEIAKICSVSSDTVTNWIKLYLEKGFKGLCYLDYDNRRKSKLESYKDIIINLVKERAITNVNKLKAILKNEYNLKVCRSWLYKYLKKIRTLL